MRTIPDGSRVVFAFGEIDCREGLLIALERARYDSLEQARRTACHNMCHRTAYAHRVWHRVWHRV